MISHIARIGAVVIALLGASPALADLAVLDGSSNPQTIFDFTCFTSKHCSSHVNINSAGTEIFTASNPGVGNITQLGSAAINLGAGTVGTGTLRVTQGSDSPEIAALGTPSDAAWTSGNGSLIALSKAMVGALNSTGNIQGLGTAGTPTGGVLTVQGQASMTPLLANPGTAANWAIGATGSAVPANGQYDGFLAANAEPTAASNGNLVGAIVGLEGKLITLPYTVKEKALRCAVDITGNTATTCTGMAAQGAGVKIYLTSLCIQRDDTGTAAVTATTNAQDSSGTNNVKIVVPNNGGGGGNCGPLPVPLVVAANTAFQITMSASTSTIRVWAVGFAGS